MVVAKPISRAPMSGPCESPLGLYGDGGTYLSGGFRRCGETPRISALERGERPPSQRGGGIAVEAADGSRAMRASLYADDENVAPPLLLMRGAGLKT